MEIIHTIGALKERVATWKSSGLSVGLVPTMGYLHDGHASLMRHAVHENDRVIVSIFINPIQFGANEDLGRYPQDIERDKDLCIQAGVDVIFNPSPSEMYPAGFYTYIDMSVVTDGLCGAKRPGHFRGVCTVVLKLFNITKPDKAYFGQKDAQQLAVIKTMARDLNIDVQIVGLPIIREPDGLAMSSRNTYLNEQERAAAPLLFKALLEALQIYRQGNTDAQQIKQQIGKVLSSNPLISVDYIEIVDIDTMQPIETINQPALCAVAVFIGQTRLIDNIVLEAGR